MSAKLTGGSSSAWDDDDWEAQADVGHAYLTPPSAACVRVSDRPQKLADAPTPPREKKVSSKVTKAQRRAEQAEFNRQLWAEAYAISPSLPLEVMLICD